VSWIKLGLIFSVDNISDALFSHAAIPIAEHLQGDRFRVYFSSRNAANESCISYFETDINAPDQVLQVCEKPLLEKGALGCFDDSGVMGSCLLSVGNKIYFYYIGWNLGRTVPFRNSIGLAVSEDGGRSFQRAFAGPILDRSRDEPYFTASNCVLFDDDVYKIWYLSCTGWRQQGSDIVHHYHIKYAESANGIDWQREGVIAIDYRDDNEYAISVPRVLRDESGYKMWFSSRAQADTNSYRINYAESINGMDWVRKDNEVDLQPSASGWDSEMLCYPFVFDHKGKRYMLYNGNGYGRSGIGLAVQA